MREFLKANKSKIIMLLSLLFVFFLVVAFVNGRNIIKQKEKNSYIENQNVSVIF